MSATGLPEIHVYTSLPRAVALGTDLDIDPSNWHWVHCLSFPLETLTTLQFSQKPYKWIRYAVGVVVGAEGDLSFSSDLPSVVDYEAGLPSELTVLYYHTSEEEKRRMFPVDPDMRTSVTSSLATTRRVHFSGDVAKRDRAHTKGDNPPQYITTYTQCRSREPTGQDIVQDIDSVWNGLFLTKTIHASLGVRDIAFLMASAPEYFARYWLSYCLSRDPSMLYQS
ncbi:hypothetical protein FA13DRAFT_1790465 [Coprinellus micaceus]|uniref:HNH nuclease domain-containing protein n=1 Tax=Coprinellus micaceus TaxID=71717 RepID=A0A4Y7TF18_COPMI|nr:hypothetical protein FA13DRAFT_1790465 [Coprinellus micaceus]